MLFNRNILLSKMREAMTRYAQDTSVSSDRSRAEIERTLARYGAIKFMYGWEENRAIIAFEAHERRIRFDLPLPNRQDRKITHTPTRRTLRTKEQQAAAYEQAVRPAMARACPRY
jgi:hypothetical protein